ncbi:F-box family protein [Striga asiatica]|uniref:F-box family protein n=1 Tax=Striga asiatica TaxID=4170 RepID=A0A5A7P712_STRAF|nr:F-box family protein [Striga asiatica]
MSQQIRHSINNSTRRSPQSYHDPWIAHWMPTANNTTSAERDYHTPRPIQAVCGDIKPLEFACEDVGTSSKSSASAGVPFLSNVNSSGEAISNNPLGSKKTRIVPYYDYLEKRKGKSVVVSSSMSLANETSISACREDFSSSLLCSRDWFKKNNAVEINKINMPVHFNLLPFSSRGKGGVNLSPLSSSSGSEGGKNAESDECKVTVRTEASAETETMEMDFLKDEKVNPVYMFISIIKQFSLSIPVGTTSTPSIKAFNIDLNSRPPKATVPSRETEHQWTKTENVCPYSSKTQSLEMDMLLANAEHIISKPSTINPDILDPSNRWVKRLKTSSPNLNPSSRGTKISRPDEIFSDDNKMRSQLRNILNSGIISSGPDNKHEGKKKISGDKNEDEEFDMVCGGKESKELLLSNAWIKRWLAKGVTDKKTDASGDSNGDKLENKRFPSIGAMALMAKAMRGLPACEIQKRGPITVWNTKTF